VFLSDTYFMQGLPSHIQMKVSWNTNSTLEQITYTGNICSRSKISRKNTCWLSKNWTKLVLGCRYLQENFWLSWGHELQQDGCIFIRANHPRLTNFRSQMVQED